MPFLKLITLNSHLKQCYHWHTTRFYVIKVDLYIIITNLTIILLNLIITVRLLLLIILDAISFAA